MAEEELSIGEFIAVIHEMAVGMEEARIAALEEGAEAIEKEAKRVLGTYDYGWVELADATKEDRARQGFPPNEPLLRTGEMRDSIEHVIKIHDLEADIGSDSDIAVYQELGTATIPPRPFFGGAAARVGPRLAKMLGERVYRVFKKLRSGGIEEGIESIESVADQALIDNAA